MGRPSDAKKRLIEAAKRTFFAHSYESVSVDELCAAAEVTKSSFYHFFTCKQDLALAALESQWQQFKQSVLIPTFANDVPPQERILRFFDLALEEQLEQKQFTGHMHGCPAGNLTLEMSTMDELIRARVEQFFQEWLTFFERMVREAQAQGIVPADLDAVATAQGLLAYFEGVVLLAKGRNDPSLIHTLRTGALSLIHYQGERVS